jgi:deoxyribodipyrimidine photo-lyase
MRHCRYGVIRRAFHAVTTLIQPPLTGAAIRGSSGSLMSRKPVILWFRNDLRLRDHAALVAASRSGAPVIPLYILDDNLPGRWAPGGASSGLAEAWEPGEEGARKRLSAFLKTAFKSYAEDRNYPGKRATSQLSPYLAFGEISPAACWRAATQAASKTQGADRALETFLKELAWREFSYGLLFRWPDLPDEPFRKEFAAFDWTENPKHLKAWQRGKTGYPIVDAGMRELWATGYMHNRVRVIAASFLIKHLRIPLQKGEAWFWDTLVDADLANNAASWQWVAGSGADAAPYFRIFNPVLQGEKFDADGAYVRRWIPELARLPNDVIHAPWTADAAVLDSAGVKLGKSYPLPIVDHREGRGQALAAYDRIKPNFTP